MTDPTRQEITMPFVKRNVPVEVDFGSHPAIESLAEHCAIVGIGGSAAFGFAAVVSHWGTGGAALEMVATVGLSLFYLWSLYLLVRFVFAFRRAWKASVIAWGTGETNPAR